MKRSVYTKEMLGPIVASSLSVRDVVKQLNLSSRSGGSSTYIRGVINKLGIPTDHFRYKNNNTPLAERFNLNIKRGGRDDCWLWLGGSERSGYGRIRGKDVNGNKIRGAHRVSYLLHNGFIDTDLLVLHKCNNKMCVNPEHLYLGTHSDNLIDSIKSGTATQYSESANAKRSLTLRGNNRKKTVC